MPEDQVHDTSIGLWNAVIIPYFIYKGADMMAPPGTTRKPIRAGMNIMMILMFLTTLVRLSTILSIKLYFLSKAPKILISRTTMYCWTLATSVRFDMRLQNM